MSNAIGNWFIFIRIFLIFYFHEVNSQLIVNVKAQNGEILRESFITNATDDFVTLDFELEDGTAITQVIDFKQDLQIFQIILLGEEELGQNAYQMLCFVLRFSKGDFISSDAMSKLRQKNPTTIRSPEGDHGTEDVQLDISLDVEGAAVFSPHITRLCHDAATTTFANEADLKAWVKSKQDIDLDWSTVDEVLHLLPSRGLGPCDALRGAHDSACVCVRAVSVWWYPCGLKYCAGRDNSGKTASYRCGIRTCRKCYRFRFYASNKLTCWEDQ